MAAYNPNPETIRNQIEAIANGDGGRWLSNFYGSTLDGSDVAAYLESIGLAVVSYRDTGRCGLVELSNSVKVSTSGYAYI